MRRKRRACACLRAQGQPVNTRFAQRLRKGRRECSRVAFAGDLGARFNWECFKQSIQDACCLELVEKRGRAPAEEDRIRFRDAPFPRRAVLSPGQRHPHSAGYPPRAPRTMQSRNTRTCLRKRARARKARSIDPNVQAYNSEFTSVDATRRETPLLSNTGNVPFIAPFFAFCPLSSPDNVAAPVHRFDMQHSIKAGVRNLRVPSFVANVHQMVREHHRPWSRESPQRDLGDTRDRVSGRDSNPHTISHDAPTGCVLWHRNLGTCRIDVGSQPRCWMLIRR